MSNEQAGEVMDFPPGEICPRIPLPNEIIAEAEPYILCSLIRGLHEKESINSRRYRHLLRSVKNVAHSQAFQRTEVYETVSNLVSQFNQQKLWRGKRLGIHGEMAFHILRNCDYQMAFRVALSYAWHGDIYIEKTAQNRELERMIQILPDACVDSSASINDFCAGSGIIDVKTHSRRERNEYVGLSVKDSWWLSPRYKSSVYVAVSERPRKNPPYDVIDYAILGYAFNDELDKIKPNNRGYRFIHFYNLHPIDLLNPSHFKTDETVHSRLYGY